VTNLLLRIRIYTSHEFGLALTLINPRGIVSKPQAAAGRS